MLDVRRLRLLVELSQRGTLAAVAEALSYSPSSVSQQLSQLEREAGVPLLVQVGRRVQLTPQAEVLVEHARAVLDRLEEAESDVARSLTTVGGTVRIAVFQSAAHAIVPQALTLLRAEHPDLRVEVTEREPELALFDVAARDFDLVIAEQYPGHTRAHRDDLDRVHLAADVIRLALPPDAASGGRVAPPQATRIEATPDSGSPLAAASDLPWVLEPAGTASREWAEQLCREAGFEPDVRFETADLMAHIRLIRSGNAVGLLPDLVWAGEVPNVALIDLPGHPQREVFSSTRLAAATRPAVVACRDALARAARADAAPRRS
ncbi:LysR family transcriptional regulator [Agromyces albus]|uniref:LysR family transcriptional regulator n=1 Tax=Agromyces albus TaxID=205332 RepID=A0A4Q2L4S3_9MICO|nr:LysR substrate-binding domain-containing protein [Agromyces albus]RXZ73218.1 LysR family transcriptional regulator [Agromyces albus]